MTPGDIVVIVLLGLLLLAVAFLLDWARDLAERDAAEADPERIERALR